MSALSELEWPTHGLIAVAGGRRERVDFTSVLEQRLLDTTAEMRAFLREDVEPGALYWILRNLPGARGIGIELDPQVCELTQRHLSILGLPIECVHADYTAVREVQVRDDALVVAFIAPRGERPSVRPTASIRTTRAPTNRSCDPLCGPVSGRD